MEAKVIPVIAVAMSREDAVELETWLGTRVTLTSVGEELYGALSTALDNYDFGEHE